MRRLRGMTLVELLVATALLALTTGATVAALAGGLKVWRRATSLGTNRQSALIAAEALRRDLVSLRSFDPVLFEGGPEEFSGAAVDRDTPEAPVAELGRLGYFFDRQERRLCRSFVPYRLAARERLRTRCETVLERVEDVQLSYVAVPPDAGAPLSGWVERWREAERPGAVKLTVVGAAESGRGDAHTVVVALPRLGVPPEQRE